MDINEYISSGVLELFVAGALSDEEARQVQLMAARHPEVRAEIEAIEKAFEAIATGHDANPRPQLRALILQQIAATGEPVRTKTPGADSTRAGAVIALPRRTRYLLAASITVAILTSVAAGYMGYRWNEVENQLADALFDMERMVQQEGLLKARYDRLAGAYDVVRGSRMVVLTGRPIAPDATARVYWDSATHHLALDATGLPPAPAGKQYQLWAIAGGKPVDAGMVAINGDSGPLLAMKDVAQAEAFAITLERPGGSQVPTLEAMYVMGNV